MTVVNVYASNTENHSELFMLRDHKTVDSFDVL
jgi:hypothetical protein